MMNIKKIVAVVTGTGRGIDRATALSYSSAGVRVKKSKKMQIIFFALMPVGILGLIFSIKLVQKSFSGNIVLEIPYSQKSAEFVISKPGNYSIWHKGQFFRKAPLDEFKPEITDKSNGTRTDLTSLLFRPNSNNGVTARMELYRFTAPAGKYLLELKEGKSISTIENKVISLVPAKMVDYDKYYIQIRDSQPLIVLLTGIVLITLSGLCIIGGLVLGILADQIFPTR